MLGGAGGEKDALCTAALPSAHAPGLTHLALLLLPGGVEQEVPIPVVFLRHVVADARSVAAVLVSWLPDGVIIHHAVGRRRGGGGEARRGERPAPSEAAAPSD